MAINQSAERLFVATSFSGHVNYETGQVHPEFRVYVEKILQGLRSALQHTVFCAVEDEGWIMGNLPPEVGMKKDLQEIDRSSALLAILPEGSISAGLQYELGYAHNTDLAIMIASKRGAKQEYVNQAVVNMGRAKLVEFETPQDLATK